MFSLVRGALLLLLALLLCSSATAAPEDLEEKQKEENRELHRAGTRAGEGPPQNLIAEGVSDSAIDVSWSHPEEEPKFYEVKCPLCSLDDVTTDTSYLAEDLDPCEEYQFTVISYYNGTDFPAETSGSTLSGTPAPESCSATSDSSGDLHVAWIKPNSQCQLSDYSTSWTWEVLWGNREHGNDSLVTPGLFADIKNPSPYTNYSIEIFASTADGVSGPPCYCGRVTPEEESSAPPLVSVTWENGFATAVWEPPEMANGLIIEYGIFLEGNNDTITTVNGDTTTAFMSLESCKLYGVYVKARNGAGWGQPSDIWEITTMEYDPPQNLVSEGVSTTAINVSWSHPECSPEHYEVQCSGCPGEDTTTDCYYLLEDLGGACKTYEVIVTAVYSNSTEVHSNTSGTTLGNKPSHPVDCKVSELSSHTFDVNWKEPATDCPLGDYNVTWSWEVMWGTEDQGTDFALVDRTSHTISKAVPYTKYTVTVAATTDMGYGPPCSLSPQTPQAEAGPPNQTNVMSGDGSLTVTWDPPLLENGIITKYGVYLDSESDPHTTVEGNTSTTLEDLDPCQRYCVSVKAYNIAGWGAPSHVQCETVAQDALPDNLDCTVNDTHVSACWWSPECPVTRYNVAWLGDVLWSDEHEENSTTVLWVNNTELCFNIPVTPYSVYNVTLSVGEKPENIRCSKNIPPAAPGPPSLKLLTKDISINASWTEPEEKNGIIADYILEWTCPGGSPYNYTMGNNETFSYIIDNLSCGETYEVTVRARTEGVEKDGQKSTPERAEISNSISEMDCSSKGPRQVFVEWQLLNPLCPVSGLTWSTRVLWSTEEEAGEDDIPVGNTTYDLSVKPYTNVSVCVHIDDSSGSEFCCSTITQQDVPSEPTDVTEVEKNCSSISLRWSLPKQVNGVLAGWLLSWSSSDSVLEDPLKLAPAQDWFLIVGLLPSTEYTVCVKATTAEGAGGCGELVFKTDDDNNKNNPKIGVIVGASVGGVALVALVVAGGLVFYGRSNKPNPPTEDIQNDSVTGKGYRQGQRASQASWERKDTVDIGNNRDRDRIRPSSLSLYGGLHTPASRHMRSNVNEAFELQETKRRSPSVPFENNRYSPQQVDQGRRPSERVAIGRRPSEQVDHGRRPSQHVGHNRRPFQHVGHNRRPSQQVDYRQLQASEHGNIFSQKVDYIRRPPQQVSKLGRLSQQVANGRRSSQQVDYNRRPSEQLHYGRPQPSDYSSRPSQQVDHGRRSSQQVNYSRRPSQQPLYLN